MDQPALCSVCAEKTTHDCVSIFKKRPKHSKTKVRYFPLKGLGPKYTFKRKLTNKARINIQNALLPFLKKLKNRADYYAIVFRVTMRAAEAKIASAVEKINKCKPTKYLKTLNLIVKNITPQCFLVTKANNRKFLNIIKLIMTQSLNECVYAEDLIKGFHLSCITWLPRGNHAEKAQVFLEGMKIILLHIIIPFIHKLFKFVPRYSYDLLCFAKSDYNTATNKMFNYLVNNDFITLCQHPPSGIRTAYLSFKPKHDKIQEFDLNSFRVIALLPKVKDCNHAERKHINKCLNQFASKLSFVKTANFFENWQMYVSAHKFKRIFMVALDINDCFGNIPIGELEEIILRSAIPPLYKQELCSAISKQFVKYGKKNRMPIVWKWNHGLLQGMRFSSALCELYLSNLEKETLQDFNRHDCFLFRKVDDYFFASTNRRDVHSFVGKVQAHLKINHAKTRSNTIEASKDKCRKSLNFCGYEINIRNFRLKCAFTSLEMYKRCRFWNIARPVPRHELIDNAASFHYVNFYFQPAFMDVNFNGAEQVLQNFFESIVFVCLKLDAAFMAATMRKFKACHNDKIYHVTLSLVKTCVKRVRHMNLEKISAIPYFKESLIVAGLRAVQVTYGRRAGKYKELLGHIEAFLNDVMKENRRLRTLVKKRLYVPKTLQDIKTRRTVKFCQI